MKEEVIRFGPGDRLTGMLALPAGGASRQGLLLFNAGLLTRIGPAGLNTALARELCAEGITTLRFDLSGLGDSASLPPDQRDPDGALRSLDAATNVLGAHGCSDICVMGLCSGADHALRFVLNDRRAARLFLIDPPAFDTRQARVERVFIKLISPRRWVTRIARLFSGENRSKIEDPFADGRPTQPQMLESLQAILDRGGRVDILYTIDAADRLTRPAHFWSVFPSLRGCERLRIYVDLQADHLFTMPTARKRLIERVKMHLNSGEERPAENSSRRAAHGG